MPCRRRGWQSVANFLNVANRNERHRPLEGVLFIISVASSGLLLHAADDVLCAEREVKLRLVSLELCVAVLRGVHVYVIRDCVAARLSLEDALTLICALCAFRFSNLIW